MKFDDTNPWGDVSTTNIAPVTSKSNESNRGEADKRGSSSGQSSSQQQQQHQELFDRARRIQLESSEEAKQVNANANLLREKLNALDAEIERFRKRNAELADKTRQLDAERRLFETEKRVFEKEKRDEMQRLKETHDEEMRKLRVEKKTFEQYKQAVKERPSRKERDEIERLDRQVSFVVTFLNKTHHYQFI